MIPSYSHNLVIDTAAIPDELKHLFSSDRIKHWCALYEYWMNYIQKEGSIPTLIVRFEDLQKNQECTLT